MIGMSKRETDRRRQEAERRLQESDYRPSFPVLDTINLEIQLSEVYGEELDAFWDKFHCCPACGRPVFPLPPACLCGCKRIRTGNCLSWVMYWPFTDLPIPLWRWLGD